MRETMPEEQRRDTPSEAVMPARRRRAGANDPEARRRGLLIVIPLVMMAAAVAGVVLTQMKDNAIYSKPVDQLVAEKARFANRQVRAEGNLVHGTLVKRESPCEF